MSFSLPDVILSHNWDWPSLCLTLPAEEKAPSAIMGKGQSSWHYKGKGGLGTSLLLELTFDSSYCLQPQFYELYSQNTKVPGAANRWACGGFETGGVSFLVCCLRIQLTWVSGFSYHSFIYVPAFKIILLLSFSYALCPCGVSLKKRKIHLLTFLVAYICSEKLWKHIQQTSDKAY